MRDNFRRSQNKRAQSSPETKGDLLGLVIDVLSRDNIDNITDARHVVGREHLGHRSQRIRR